MRNLTEAAPGQPPRDREWWETAPIAEICRPPSAVPEGPRDGRIADRETLKRVNKLLLRRRQTVVRRADAPVCKAPGCGAALYHGNRSGVCREHNHLLGYCGCAECGRKTDDG